MGRILVKPGIYKKGNKYSILYTGNGKQYYEATHSTVLKDAEDLLRKRLHEVFIGTFFPEADLYNPTLEELAKKYLSLPAVIQSKCYKWEVTRFKRITEYFGKDKKVRSIQEQDINDFIVELQKTMKASTINRFTRMFKTALYRCCNFNEHWNPFKSLKALPEINTRTGVVSKEQFDGLIDNCKDKEMVVMITISYYLGLRLSTVLNLERSMIDVDKKTLTIPGMILKNGTTYAVPLNDHIIEAVKALPAIEGTDRLFRVRSHSAISHNFTKLAKSLGYTNCIFHNLRRGACTNLLRAGVDSAIVQRILGWKSPEMLTRYQKLVVEDLRGALDLVSK
jgi:integrase